MLLMTAESAIAKTAYLVGLWAGLHCESSWGVFARDEHIRTLLSFFPTTL
jgi:hypothetical protein